MTARSIRPRRLLLDLRTPILAGLAALATLPALALDVPATKVQIEASLAPSYPELDALYKALHSHPELGFQEAATTARPAAQMRVLGVEVTEGVGKTGLVAVYGNGAGPKVPVSTGLDTLPIAEKTGLPCASRARATWNGTETAAAHSCGNDIHMASWVGTAQALVVMKAQWRGTLMFIAQPSEETVTGAQAMLNDGVFASFGQPDLGFALHLGTAPAGAVSYQAGVISSNSDVPDIIFVGRGGRGGHGSSPSLTIDPVWMAARMVEVQGVVSREKDAAQFGVVTIGAIHGGSAGNLIPDSVQLRGTARSYSPEVRFSNPSNAVVNDVALTECTAEVFRAALWGNAKPQSAPGSASEDHAEFIIVGVPSVFFGIGGSDPVIHAQRRAAGKQVPANHSPFFAPAPEPSIRTGVTAMALAVLNAMQ